MSMLTNQNSSATSEYEEYGDAEGYETTEYYSGESYSEDTGESGYYQEDGYQDPPPPPAPGKKAPRKKKKKKVVAKKGKSKKAVKAMKEKKSKKAKVKKGKSKKGKTTKGKATKGKKPAASKTRLPPPPPAYQEYYEEPTDQSYVDGYTEAYPQEEYYPMDDQGVVIEDQAMIETVVVEEENAAPKKPYQRLTDDPIYSIEEKIDRMLMGKELSLAERFQRKFGEEFVMEESTTLTSYTKREIYTGEAVPDEDVETEKKIKGPVPKEKGEKLKKEKKVRKKEKKDKKKVSRFGGIKKFGAGKPKAKKGLTVAEIMGKKDSVPVPQTKSKKVSDAVKKPKPAVKPDKEEEEMDYEEFSTFKTVVDDLLENLAEEVLDSFMASDEFKIYERVGTADDFTGQDTEYITIVDNLLEKLPENIVNEFMESENFKLYQKMVEWGSE